MQHWGSQTPKRTSLYSNSLEIRRFDLGRLARSEMKKSKVKTSKRYVDRHGRLVWTGSKALKSTQRPGLNLSRGNHVFMQYSHIAEAHGPLL